MALIVAVDVFVIVALALNILMGYSGQFTVMHAAMMGVSAYTAGAFSTHLGLNTAWGALIGATAAAVVAAAFSLLARALGGETYMLASLAFQMALNELMLQWVDITGGDTGRYFSRPAVAGLDMQDQMTFVAVATVVAVVCAGLLVWLGRSSFALTLRAMRDSPRAIESLGRSTTAIKLKVYALFGFFCGVAGVISSADLRFLHPTQFSVQASILVIVFVIAGGSGRSLGVVVAVVLLTMAPQAISFIPFVPSARQAPLELMFYGLVLVVFMLVRPRGAIPEKPILASRRLLQGDVR
jgi:branched-chain amino acid transport system permease protein